MPRQVQMPDGQVVEMPDKPTPEQVTRLKAVQQRAQQPPKKATTDYSTVQDVLGSDFVQDRLGAGEALANTVSGVIAKPVSDVAGLAATGKEMIAPGGGDPAAFKRHVQESLTYEPKTESGKTMAKYNPLALVGDLVSSGAGKVRDFLAPQESSGIARNAMGAGVEEAIKQAPQFFGAKGGKALGETVGETLKKSGRNWMTSATKPTEQMKRSGKADQGIETMLKEGYNATHGGAEKMQARVDALNDRISTLIENSPAVIDRNNVAGYLHDTMQKFEAQVNNLSDVAAIQKAWDEFLVTQPEKIPVQRAQELKTGTYRQLKGKYGELKGAEIESQKTLARGLKEEIAKEIPKVRELNAEESRLLDALSITERRAFNEAKNNPIGLGILAESPSRLAAWMADRSGLFKSLVARMLYTGGEVGGPGVSAAAPAAGVAISQDRSKEEEPQ